MNDDRCCGLTQERDSQGRQGHQGYLRSALNYPNRALRLSRNLRRSRSSATPFGDVLQRKMRDFISPTRVRGDVFSVLYCTCGYTATTTTYLLSALFGLSGFSLPATGRPRTVCNYCSLPFCSVFWSSTLCDWCPASRHLNLRCEGLSSYLGTVL
jgi:hypothetical protein